MNYSIVPTEQFAKDLKRLFKKYPSINEDVLAAGLGLSCMVGPATAGPGKYLIIPISTGTSAKAVIPAAIQSLTRLAGSLITKILFQKLINPILNIGLNFFQSIP
jgi:hypothetical protein